ncbi:VOC family protein [Actinotalea sp. Marseille-Q4924]|uniref:VOC family protein n=1 Tax=Actinotalea sp. Marseille-Q4924 TaxID=2866571 RepID=UPI00351D7FAF
METTADRPSEDARPAGDVAADPRPVEDRLTQAADVDAVTLHVGDLGAMTDYYRDALGLVTLAEGRAARREGHAEEQGGETSGRGEVVLGRRGRPVLVLRHTPGLPQPSRRQAGLFHTAVLFDDQRDLAATVLTAARHPRSTYVGSADHLVSEAFYFTDPEGNGIELYRDRPRETWTRGPGSRVLMDSLWLDPQEYLRAHVDEAAVTGLTDAAAKVGHVHLQVGDLATARDFYVETLGFDVAAEMPGALFVAVGGYHHHLAMNTWNSAGAGPRASTLGLGDVTITVPTRADLDAAVTRLRRRGVQVADDGAVVRTTDPWRNSVTLQERAAA